MNRTARLRVATGGPRHTWRALQREVAPDPVPPEIDDSWTRGRSIVLADRRVDIACSSAALAERFDDLLAALPTVVDAGVCGAGPPTKEPVDLRIDDRPTSDAGTDGEGFTVWVDGRLHARGRHRCCCEHRVLNLVNRIALDDDDRRLHLHSGLVALGSSGVLVVGTTGAGKSTLVAWLTHHGWTYLTDEMVPISTDRRLWPYPRPVTLKAGAWSLFDRVPALEATVGSAANHPGCGRTQIAPGALPTDVATGPVDPALIVFVHHGAARTRVVPVEPRDALIRLIPEVLDLERMGVAGMQMLVDITNGVPAVELEIADLDGVAGLLRRALPASSNRPDRTTATLPLATIGGGRPGRPDTIDARTPVALVKTCRVWPMAGGGVLYDLAGGVVLRIDERAVHVLGALDGRRALATIAAELEPSDAAHDGGTNDLVAFARTLAELGLVEVPLGTDAAAR